MIIRSNIVKVQVAGKFPVTLEAVQLTIQNAKRLFEDSKNVSIPTEFALLELGLEEVAKAWGMVMTFEKRSQDENPDFFVTQFKVAHIEKEKYNTIIKEIKPKIKEFFSKNNPDLFMMPFDSENWYDHKAKISYHSKFIKYTREITIPMARASSDRAKAVGDILRGYISKKYLSDFEKLDAEIDKILNVDEEQLIDIVKLKENGLYVDIKNNVYVSPSSIPYETETLENLLNLFIEMVKGEVKVLLVTLQEINSPRFRKVTVNKIRR